jgi:hypothetical protein
VVRRVCDKNKLSGTIGGWIGSMAKLAVLQAPLSGTGRGRVSANGRWRVQCGVCARATTVLQGNRVPYVMPSRTVWG